VEGKGNDLLSPFFEAVREEFSQMREKKNREQGLERGSARAFFFCLRSPLSLVIGKRGHLFSILWRCS
jgi:hypothetical protein